MPSEENTSTPEERIASLETRVEALTHQVASLERQLAAQARDRGAAPLNAPLAKPSPPLPDPPVFVPPVPARRGVRAWSSEDWLNRIGIGLLLFGVAFLFKYSIDAGWLTPTVRVLFGVALGAFLLVVGWRLRRQPERARLGQILLGGSIATFYGTLFAAYQFYALLPHSLAFAGMVAVTLLAFGLAVQQDDAALSVVAVVGGLATPFLLYSEAGSVPGLVAYTSLVLVGAGAVYLLQGWRTLLGTAYLGGWLVLLFALVSQTTLEPLAPTPALQALRAGGLLMWILFAGVPVVRAWREARVASAPPPSGPDTGPTRFGRLQRSVARARRYPGALLAFGAPLAALAYEHALWVLPDATWGALALSGAVLYGGAYLGLHRLELPTVAQAHGLVAAVLVAYAAMELFAAELVLLVLAVEAAALHLLGHRQRDAALRLAGHVFFGVAALVATLWLYDMPVRPALVNAEALAQASVIILGAAVALTLLMATPRLVYLFGAHLLLLAWFYHELHTLPSGEAYVTVVWGVYAVALLVAGVRLDEALVRNTALATVLVIVGKLFLVDLGRLDAVWRILLFLGFGGLLLLISYALPRLWRAGEKAPDPRSSDPRSSDL